MAEWTTLYPAGELSQEWLSCAANSDGSVLLVGNRFSVDGGIIWNMAPSALFRCCACSYNGSVLLGGVYQGRLWLSTNGGTDWAETKPIGDASSGWVSCAVNDNGSVLLAGNTSGYLWLSTNGGVSWASPRAPYDGIYAIACDTTGSIILTGGDYHLQLSINGGASWPEQRPAGDVHVPWYSCSSNANGSILLAGVYGGRLWLSINGGTTWAETQPAGNTDFAWESCAASDDGSVLLAGISPGRLWLSNDSGTTWTEQRPEDDTNRSWRSCAVSSNGLILLAANMGGQAYIGINELATQTATNANMWPQNW